MSDIQFIPGLIAKAPHPKAPDFVKASLSIKRAELIAWLQSQEGEWINADIKEAKSGKWYVPVNAYKREESQPNERQRPAMQDRSAPAHDGFQDDDLPF